MTSAVKMAITVSPAQFRDDFEAIRLIRNAGRQWMEDTDEISPETQELFRLTHPRVLAYRVGGVIVGYGMVTRRLDGCLYVSLAVHPDYQGKGVGTHIYWDQRKRWTVDPVYARCRATNVASIRAAQTAGYVTEPEMSDENWVVLRGDRRD
jgi:GNAT superfamily N-acetyltransferase